MNVIGNTPPVFVTAWKFSNSFAFKSVFASVTTTPDTYVPSVFVMNAVNFAASIACSIVNVAKLAPNSNVASFAATTNDCPPTSGPTTPATGLTITSIVRSTVFAPSVAVNVNGNVPPVVPAATIAASSAASTVISVISLLIVVSAFNKNALAFAKSFAVTSVNVFASAFSRTNPVADNCKLPSVVTTSSFGSTMKLTVIEAVKVPSVTVNVIGNTPPVSVTALNASN